ncbi:MAG: aminotransferase class I/II-fold pyridoxal phosphate-dependent enzyme [Nitratireductor sp.]
MQDETRCVTKATVSLEGYDSLTVPVYRASTIRYPDAASFTARFERDADGYVYGLYGTPTHRHLEYKLTELEGGARTVLAPSGQAAITSTFLALLRAGDRVLIPDTVYGPVRDFARHELSALGIDAQFYDPGDLAALAAWIDERTRLIWVESPGSITLEVQDLAAIVALAHDAGALVGCDNTWASPLNFKPLDHGADIVVEALSKHFSGHSDVLMGSVTLRDETLGTRLKAAFGRLGIGVSPDDCVLVLRGIETLPVRLKAAAASAAAIVDWLVQQPLVDRVFFPALPGSQGHETWKRDFAGACGVLTFSLTEPVRANANRALDALELISIGASWGGTKSLIAPTSVKDLRTARPWTGADSLMRLRVGLEHPQDLVTDLERFFASLKPAAIPTAAAGE